MDNTEQPPRVLSLCTGYGGLEIGLERALGKITVLAHMEIEAFAIANLVDKMESGQMVPAPIWTDLKTFNARPFRGCVDILTGGYPCQPFSSAGKREGTDDPRHLWPYIRDIIFDCQPRQVFFENVEGHLSMGILSVLSELESMGYKIETGIFSAEEVGAPHRRKRVFILAESSDSRRGPAATTEKERQTGLRETGSDGTRWEERPNVGRGCKGSELGDSPCSEKQRMPEQIRDGEGMQVGRSGGDVSDSFNNGSGKRHRDDKPEFSYENGVQWPARPGQSQYKWEEPRIVDDSKDSDRRT